ncbi:non-ribosomal peptide synthetase [Plantactinospora sp. KLBMP9567]|uniref:non-ribosomal peptide synthetase n=1 Tax=Plantactinospora sp. KLBMP9567 TaxID=3085900 RepID=UPI00298159E1|nr:non-ribosomal peptide synthetase [Plantactinospora sp. KLBMP9567]MDW5330241.1 amino acid adenylation domain-containing protein [Plantactinospora sp. KLBMP9567]
MTEWTSRIAALPPERRALLDRLREQRRADRDSIVPRARHDEAPLSFAQQRMWFLHQYEPESPAYTIYEVVRTRGVLDVSALRRAVAEVCRRHEVLRSTYPIRSGQVRQEFTGGVAVLDVRDLTGVPEPEREAAALDHAVAEARRPFDIATGPLLRAALLRLRADEHLLVLTMHHIVSDGWSTGVLVGELTTLYAAFAAGHPSPLPELPIQYADFAAWQRDRLRGPVLDRELAYWRDAMAGAPAALELPTDRPRPPRQSYRGGYHRFRLERGVVEGLVGVGRGVGATLFMTLLAGFVVVLSRYSGQREVCVGTPVANRSRAELEGLIGFFVNTLVLRVGVSGGVSFRGLVGRVRDVVVGGLEHGGLPFERLVEELRPVRRLSHAPLFQVMFVLQNAPQPPLSTAQLAVEHVPLHNGTTKLDLTLVLTEDADGVAAAVEYDSDIFDPATVARFADHYRNLLAAALTDPDRPLWRASLLGRAEHEQLVAGGNGTGADIDTGRTVVDLFDCQVARAPDAVAVRHGEVRLTYRELDERANQVAHRLRLLGVGPDRVVGVCLERSVELVVALLAVLKAGGAYAPLDPGHPARRLSFLVRDCGATAVLTHAAGQPAGLEGVPRVALEPFPAGSAGVPVGPPSGRPGGLSLAYVIYTSGSTGTPKAVMSTHQGLLNRLLWMQETYRLTPGDRVLQKTPFGFDVSVWEFFWPLLAGAQMVVADPGVHRDPAALADLITTAGVTTVHFVPSMLRPFLDELGLDEPGSERCRSLRHVICSGEALPVELARRCAATLDAGLHNLYGPTEASIDVTAWAYGAGDGSTGPTVPIGHPIANTSVHVLDERLHPVPVGVAGELYLGGLGLARGYLGRADLTAERFVPDPFAVRQGARLYRTGDRARRRPDGAIEYLGRLDRQVKVRGQRIEPGEIEAVLREHPEVADASVLAWVSPAGPAQLVGYLVAAPGAAPAVPDLLDFLRERLPAHLIPSPLMLLDALPVTANGKLDRAALPAPGDTRPDVGTFVPPATPGEEILASVLAAVLGLDRVGVQDNFFALGGDSIRAIEVLALARERGVPLSLRDLFSNPTVRELARTPGGRQDDPAGAPGPVDAPFALIPDEERERLPPDAEDAYPLTALQAGMIFDNEYRDDFSIYHDVFSFHLRGRFDPDAFDSSVIQLADRHPVLRTSIDLHSFREPRQVVHRGARVPVAVTDLRDAAPQAQEAAIADWLDQEKERGFSWSAPSLVRLHVHLRGPDAFQATFSCSNVMLDGWSMASMLTELFTSYAALLRGGAAPAAQAPASTFRRYVGLELAAVESAAHRDYWAATLRGASGAALPRWPVPESEPESEPAPEPGAARAPARRRRHAEPVSIPPEVGDGLHRLARRAAVPVKSVLFAAHLRVMSLRAGEPATLTGLVTNGRPEERDGERALGLYLNVVPVPVTVPAGSWTELVRHAFEVEREMSPHRRYPAGRMAGPGGQPPRLRTAFNFVQFHVYRLLEGVTELALLDARTFDDTNFPLWTEFGVDPATSRISAELSYDAAELPPAQVRAVAREYAAVLAAMVREPDGRCDRLRSIDPAGYEAVVTGWNGTGRPVPVDRSLPELFAAQVARTPAATAYLCAGERISYAELDRRANRLAHRLRALGAGPEQVVAVCLDRSPHAAVALLAVLKAGGVYAPLDPAQPPDRMATLLAATGAAVLVTRSELSRVPPPPGVAVLAVDHTDPPGTPDTDPGVAVHPDALAYLLHTSGSTGRPKAVAVAHRQVLNRLAWMWHEYPFGAGEVGCQKTSLGFVDSLWELLGPLLRGVPTVIIPDEEVRDPARLVRALAEHGVTRIWLVPTLLRVLLEHQTDLAAALPRLVYWVTSGEALTPELLRLFRRRLPGRRLLNIYGTSEVWDVTCHEPGDRPVPAVGVPIGRPIWNMRAHVLGTRGEPVPVGVPGELYVGGVGLARGYHDDPELTAQAFVPDPFGPVPGGRLYRTGDRACQLPGGDILYLDRRDRQLKVRGVRVEPAEVEAVLRSHPAVREAVVLGVPGADGARILAAYVAAGDPEPSTAELRRFARDRLPPHLLPARLAVLPDFPVTTSGKVDRVALAALPPPAEDRGQPSTPPRGVVEETLCDVWSEVLGRDRIGVDEDFLDAGGDSLAAMRVVAELRRHGWSVPVRTIFETSTVAELARRLPERAVGAHPVRAPVPRLSRAPGDRVPMSFAQRRLWLVHQMGHGGAQWNVFVAARLHGPLDVEVLRGVLREIVRRHEVLRTTFPDPATWTGEPAQCVREELPPEFRLADLGQVPESDREERLREVATTEIRRPFDLAQGPLLRALVVRVGPDEHVAVLAAHHIACDGWSMELLLAEISALYPALAAGGPAPLPALPVQYPDYALWQRERLRGARLAALLDRWRDRLRDAPDLLDLPGGTGSGGDGRTDTRVLPPALGDAVRDLAARAGATLFMALLAAYALVLRRLTGRDDMVIGTDVAGRDQPELAGLIGFFVNQLPLRVQLSGVQTFADLLARVRDRTLSDYAHDEMPFDRLVEELKPLRRPGRSPLFQVKLVLQNVPEHQLRLPGVRLVDYPLDRGTAQVDLNLRAARTTRGVVLSAEYDTARVAPSTVRLLLAQLEAVLDQVVAEPTARLDDLDAALEEREREHGEREAAALAAAARDGLRGARRRPLPRVPDAERRQ